MKKKTKQKKIVVEKTEWIEPLFDVEAQVYRSCGRGWVSDGFIVKTFL